MLSKLERQTKLIWSFDGSALSPEFVDPLTTGYAQSVRLVHSPKFQESILAFMEQVRRRAPKISIMFDVAGLARGVLRPFESAQDLAYGETVIFVPKQGAGHTFGIETDEWETLFAPDATVYLGYGNVVLRVQDIGTQEVRAEVIQGGTVQSGMEVHVPETRRPINISDLESVYLDRVLGHGVDYLVVPGSLSRQELIELQNHIQTRNSQCPFLILKIDSVSAYEQLGSMLDVVDGVFISRREIALTTDPANLPMITKEIIQICNDRAKLSVVASEMLASMRHNPTPTRAEVSDVANAVIDRTDGIVLSEEVSCGRFGLKAIELMAKIVSDVENHEGATPNWRKDQPSIAKEDDAVAYAAYRIAHRLQAKAIVCITHSGNTPMRISSFGVPIPILAVTFSEAVLRRLSLVRGVTGIVLDTDPNLDEVLPLVNDHLKRESWLSEGDRIVFVSLTLSSVGREASNLVTVQRLN